MRADGFVQNVPIAGQFADRLIEIYRKRYPLLTLVSVNVLLRQTLIGLLGLAGNPNLYQPAEKLTA
jgi:hypothetical protein